MADEQQTKTQPGAGSPTQPGTNGHGPAPSTNGTGGAPPPAAVASAAPEKKAASGTRLIIGVIVLAVVAVGVIFGVRFVSWSRVHVSTDDAYVTGNLVNVSPLIGGTLTQLAVSEGDVVHKGQLLARLDDSGEKSALRQAQAAYDAARSQIPQARSSLSYEEAATEAAINRARSGIIAQQARTKGAAAQVRLATGQTHNQVKQAESQMKAAQAQFAQVTAQVGTARAAVAGYRQAVLTAQGGVKSLQAKVQSAQSDLDKASRDEARYKKLLAQEAVTQQQYDVVGAQLSSAQSNLSALNEQIGQAQSQVQQAQANVDQSLAQLNAAEQAANASREQVDVARSGVALAQSGQTQVAVQNSNLAAIEPQTNQAEADLSSALAGNSQVTLQKQKILTAQAQAQQALAAVTNAKVEEDDTYIYAPSDGVVVRKNANVGASLSPGQTILTITQGQGVFVTANFKETQITNVRPGQPVEIEVDAFPGKKFDGIVGAISEATGATTSLLPPDNATGNFTKVVQRVAVKIAIVPGKESGQATAEDITLLRQGMSVVATIDTNDVTAHPERIPAGYDQGGTTASTGEVSPGGGTPMGSGGAPTSGGGDNVTAPPTAPVSNGSENGAANAPNVSNPNVSTAPAANGGMPNGQPVTGAAPQPNVGPQQAGQPNANGQTNPAAQAPGINNADPAANGSPAAAGGTAPGANAGPGTNGGASSGPAENAGGSGAGGR